MKGHNQEKNGDYISLTEASQYTGDYSQEYLSLRARQGKLKAIKFGRNWVTKKEWVDQYLEHIKEYNNEKNHLSDTKKVKAIKADKTSQFNIDLDKEFNKIRDNLLQTGRTISNSFISLFQPARRPRIVAVIGALVLFFISFMF